MVQVPSNLIPTRVTQLQDAPVPSHDGLLLYTYNGNTYKIRAGDLLATTTIPFGSITSTPTTIAGYGITDAADYAPVQSVFGRTGAVAAVSGDYTSDLVTLPASRKIGVPAAANTELTIMDAAWSAGVLTGMGLADNGDGSVTIASGTAIVRSGENGSDALYNAVVSGGVVTLTNNALNIVHVYWNSGAPVLDNTTTVANVTGRTRVAAWAVYREGTVLHSLDLRNQNVDTSLRMRQLFLNFSRFIHAAGGSVLGSNGLALTLTAGTFYVMINPITHVAFDTSVAGTANANVFTNWYRNGAGGWVEVANSKVIDTTVYDNNVGTPSTLNNNHYGVTWVYVVNDTPSELHCVMGQDNYNTRSDALAATPPATLPGLITELGSIVGAVVYKKAAVGFSDVLSAFVQAFVTSSATTHNGLSGLQGGTTDEYYHLTNAEYTGSGTGVFARIAGPTFTGSVGGIVGGTF